MNLEEEKQKKTIVEQIILDCFSELEKEKDFPKEIITKLKTIYDEGQLTSTKLLKEILTTNSGREENEDNWTNN